jgi:hypothetical protein
MARDASGTWYAWGTNASVLRQKEIVSLMSIYGIQQTTVRCISTITSLKSIAAYLNHPTSSIFTELDKDSAQICEDHVGSACLFKFPPDLRAAFPNPLGISDDKAAPASSAQWKNLLKAGGDISAPHLGRNGSFKVVGLKGHIFIDLAERTNVES